MTGPEEHPERGGDEAGRGDSAAHGEVGGGGSGADGGGGGGAEGGGRRQGSAELSERGNPTRLSRLPALARAALGILGPVLLTTAYFTVPFDVIGPRHADLAWLILASLLALLAIGMVVTTDRALTDQVGRYRNPGLGILLLSWAAILVFAASYWAMATRQGQFVGLQTRLDALYFTGITMATVGYGDVHPSGQLARAVVLVQLVYTFAFLVGGIAALRTRARAKMVRRLDRG